MAGAPYGAARVASGRGQLGRCHAPRPAARTDRGAGPAWATRFRPWTAPSQRRGHHLVVADGEVGEIVVEGPSGDAPAALTPDPLEKIRRCVRTLAIGWVSFRLLRRTGSVIGSSAANRSTPRSDVSVSVRCVSERVGFSRGQRRDPAVRRLNPPDHDQEFGARSLNLALRTPRTSKRFSSISRSPWTSATTSRSSRPRLGEWPRANLEELMRTLVTGGGSVLGGAVVRRLVSSSDNIRTLQRTTPTSKCVPSDIADPDESISSPSCDQVWPLPPRSMWGPREPFGSANVVGTEKKSSNPCAVIESARPSSPPSAAATILKAHGIAVRTQPLRAALPRDQGRSRALVLRRRSWSELSTSALRPHLMSRHRALAGHRRPRRAGQLTW